MPHLCLLGGSSNTCIYWVPLATPVFTGWQTCECNTCTYWVAPQHLYLLGGSTTPVFTGWLHNTCPYWVPLATPVFTGCLRQHLFLLGGRLVNVTTVLTEWLQQHLYWVAPATPVLTGWLQKHLYLLSGSSNTCTYLVAPAEGTGILPPCGSWQTC